MEMKLEEKISRLNEQYAHNGKTGMEMLRHAYSCEPFCKDNTRTGIQTLFRAQLLHENALVARGEDSDTTRNLNDRAQSKKTAFGFESRMENTGVYEKIDGERLWAITALFTAMKKHSETEIATVEISALLHDVNEKFGKIGLPVNSKLYEFLADRDRKRFLVYQDEHNGVQCVKEHRNGKVIISYYKDHGIDVFNALNRMRKEGKIDMLLINAIRCGYETYYKKDTYLHSKLIKKLNEKSEALKKEKLKTSQFHNEQTEHAAKADGRKRGKEDALARDKPQ
jgi:hypothetical protein